MSEKFRLDLKNYFQNTFYTKYINIIFDSTGPSIISRSILFCQLNRPNLIFKPTYYPYKMVNGGVEKPDSETLETMSWSYVNYTPYNLCLRGAFILFSHCLSVCKSVHSILRTTGCCYFFIFILIQK